MAIPDEVRRLRQVRNGLLVKRGWTRGVELKVAEIEAEAYRLLGDAARHSEVVRSLAEVRAKLDALREALGLAVDLVGQAIAHHSRTTGIGSSQASAAPRTIPPGPMSPVRGPAGAYVANQHGDLYPEEAIPYHEALQRRVVRGSGMPIAGWIQLDGAHIGEITATPNDPWAEASAERMADLDPRRAAFVAHHVEMKVIAMMVSLGSRHGQVIINHAPCGSEQGDPPGCHTSIPRCLPTGRTLTVLGTDRNGEPFTRTYHGKAKW